MTRLGPDELQKLAELVLPCPVERNLRRICILRRMSGLQAHIDSAQGTSIPCRNSIDFAGLGFETLPVFADSHY